MEITSLNQLDLTKQYTYADYLSWQFQERVELIGGYVWEMSAPNRRHQRMAGDFYGYVWNYLRKKPCQVFSAPFDVRLPRIDKVTKESIITVVQPDVCVICNLTKLDTAGCLGGPDWVVEVLSKGNTKKEMREKYMVYEEAGVREYWVVQPEYDNILVYVTKPVLDEGDLASPYIFPDLQLPLHEIFADPLKVVTVGEFM